MHACAGKEAEFFTIPGFSPREGVARTPSRTLDAKTHWTNAVTKALRTHFLNAVLRTLGFRGFFG